MTNKLKHAVKSDGFTLIEALFASMLLGLVIAALVAASGAFTMANGYGLDLSTSEFLIEEIREHTGNESFDTIVANYSGGQTYSPPIDLAGTPMPAFGQFSQQVNAVYVQASDLNQVVTSGTSDFVRVTVTVTKNGGDVNSTSWIRAKLN